MKMYASEESEAVSLPDGDETVERGCSQKTKGAVSV